MSAIDRYLANNARYADGFTLADLSSAPADRIAIVTCMDARLDTGTLLGLRAGGAHVLRNAGGIVTEDVIRSLTLSQNLLHTREIMLIQHTRCGLTAPSDAELEDAIEEGTGIRPGFPLGAFSDVEASVRASIERLRDSPLLPHRDAIRGFVYEVESGRLREVR